MIRDPYWLDISFNVFSPSKTCKTNLDLKSAANIANYIAGQVIGHLGERPEIILPKTPEDLEKKIA